MREMTIEEDNNINTVVKKFMNNPPEIQQWVDEAKSEYDIDQDDILPLIRTIICLRTDYRSMNEIGMNLHEFMGQVCAYKRTEEQAANEDEWLDYMMQYPLAYSDDLLNFIGTEDRMVFRAHFMFRDGDQLKKLEFMGANNTPIVIDDPDAPVYRLYHQMIELNKSLIFGHEHSDYVEMKKYNEWLNTGRK